MTHRRIEKTIGSHERHVRCLIHPIQVRERDGGVRKFQDATLMPPNGINTISMHRQEYTTEEKLVEHGHHLCKPGTDQRFSGFLFLTRNVVDSVNQWLNSAFGKLKGYDYRGANPGADIKYAPMIDDDTYYEGDDDLYTDTPGVTYPHHSDLSYEPEFVACKTLNRQYAHELQKRAKLQFVAGDGSLGSSAQEEVFQMFDSDPILSIIVPFHKDHPFIRTCAESIYSEIVNKPVEVIWVNDGSTDRSCEIVEEYVNRYPRYSYLYDEDNQGQGMARNHGLEVARGQYIWFVDADDKIRTGAVDVILSELDNKHDAYLFRIEESDDNNITLKSKRRFWKTKEVCSIDGAEIILQKLSFTPSLMFVFRRNVLLEKNISFKEYRNLDIDFMPRFLLSGVKIKVVPKVIYIYFYHNKKMSPRKYRNQDTIEMLEMFDKNSQEINCSTDQRKVSALLHVQQMILVHVLGDINKKYLPNHYNEWGLDKREEVIKEVIRKNNYRGSSLKEYLFWRLASRNILLAKKWFG